MKKNINPLYLDENVKRRIAKDTIDLHSSVGKHVAKLVKHNKHTGKTIAKLGGYQGKIVDKLDALKKRDAGSGFYKYKIAKLEDNLDHARHLEKAARERSSAVKAWLQGSNPGKTKPIDRLISARGAQG